MPTQTNRLKHLRDAAGDGDIPYISKSRVKKWLTCKESFNFSYLKGYKEPENFWMRRGTAVHEAFEDYYAAAEKFVDRYEVLPSTGEMIGFLPHYTRWADYTVPFITNFIAFERRRQEALWESGIESEREAARLWLPVEVEGEAWLDDPLDYGDEAIPWMGFADAIYHACSVPGFEGEDGVVIVDFKTGKTPNPKYRDEGIYLEGEYYSMLFEPEYDVTGVAGYYPKNDDLVVSPLSEKRRAKIRQVVHEMQAVSGEKPDHLDISEQPLCYWDEDGKCAYYDMCASRWGEPLKHADKTREMVRAGASDGAIADALGCGIQHVRYAKKKLGL